MPVEYPPHADPSDTVGWMRFVEDTDDGIQAAILQASVGGRPLAFSFTRMARDTVGTGPTRDNMGESTDRTLLTHLATSLLGTTDAPLALALVLIDDPLSASYVDTPEVGVPFCCIGPGNTPECGNIKVHWETEQLRGDSGAQQVLSRVLDTVDPLEAFDRIFRALTEAFADSSVRDLATVPGLTTMVSLSPLREQSAPKGELQRGGSPSLSLSEGGGRPLTLAERLRIVLSPHLRRRASDADLRLHWTGELMPFQMDGVQALLREERLLLADDMGLGKTVQVIAALRILKARQRIRACLVVAPASVLDQWRREIEKWASELTAIIIRGHANDRWWQWKARADIILVSYDTLRSDSDVERVRRNTWDVVVADEAQRIKNRNETSHLLKRLRRRRSWALTGTPLENSEEELASIMEFVDHRQTGPPRHYHPGEALRQRHRNLQLRRKKNEVLPDLPPKRVTKISVDLTSSQRSSYTKAEEEGIYFLRSLGAEVRVKHVFELITRLKQICNADPETGQSSKLEDIAERMERLTAQGHRALIFSQYTTESYGVLKVAAHLRDFDPLTLTGDNPEPERATIIDRFKTRKEHKVLVLSLRAGGVGLNLQEASYVFHLDRWWNPAVERQAEDRSHRIGQTVKVNAIKYSSRGTIEERIDRILDRKQALFESLIDDVSLDLSTMLTREELLGLFGIETGPPPSQPGNSGMLHL